MAYAWVSEGEALVDMMNQLARDIAVRTEVELPILALSYDGQEFLVEAL